MIDEQTQQVLQILNKCASKRETIFYDDLYEQIKLNWGNPSDRNSGTKILEAVSRMTIKTNRTLLSAIVVLSVDGIPACDFYEFATKLNLLKKSASEEEMSIFWAEQVEKVFQAHCK